MKVSTINPDGVCGPSYSSMAKYRAMISRLDGDTSAASIELERYIDASSRHRVLVLRRTGWHDLQHDTVVYCTGRGRKLRADQEEIKRDSTGGFWIYAEVV